MQNKKIFKMTLTAMFAAMIFVLTRFVQFPVASGYVHLGDALIYICAGILGGPWGIIAGAIGATIADLTSGFAIYAPASCIIKALIAVPFVLASKNSKKILTPLTALMSVVSGLITVGGYFLADLIIDKKYAIVDIPGNVIQAVGSAILFIVLAAAFDAAKLKQRILKEK